MNLLYRCDEFYKIAKSKEHETSSVKVNGKTRKWDVWKTLIPLADKLESKEVNISLFNKALKHFPWHEKNFSLDSFMYHMEAIIKADLKYPIIVGPDNKILNGYHRLMKAKLNGKKKIKIVKLKEYPKSDY
jgi:hypothetical protein